MKTRDKHAKNKCVKQVINTPSEAVGTVTFGTFPSLVQVDPPLFPKVIAVNDPALQVEQSLRDDIQTEGIEHTSIDFELREAIVKKFGSDLLMNRKSGGMSGGIRITNRTVKGTTPCERLEFGYMEPTAVGHQPLPKKLEVQVAPSDILAIDHREMSLRWIMQLPSEPSKSANVQVIFEGKSYYIT